MADLLFPWNQSVDPTPQDDNSLLKPPSAGSSALAQAGKVGGPIGDVVGGIAGIFGGIVSQQQSERQAQRYEQQAKLDLYDAGREVMAQETKGVQMMSGTAAMAGAGGVTQAGSVANAMRATINHVNEADIASRFAGKVRNLEDIYEAKQQVYQGKQQMLGGLITGLASFAKAGTDAAAGGML